MDLSSLVSNPSDADIYSIDVIKSLLHHLVDSIEDSESLQRASPNINNVLEYLQKRFDKRRGFVLIDVPPLSGSPLNTVTEIAEEFLDKFVNSEEVNSKPELKFVADIVKSFKDAPLDSQSVVGGIAEKLTSTIMESDVVDSNPQFKILADIINSIKELTK